MINLVYRYSLFGDFISINATPENSIMFMESLNQDGGRFIPSTIMETFPPENVRAPMLRLVFIDSTNNITLRIMSNRIDVETGFDESFSEDSYNTRNTIFFTAFKHIWEKLPSDTKSNRLAFFSQNLLPAANNEKLESFMHSSVSYLPFYDDTLLEWNIHINTRKTIIISGNEEQCNFITDIAKGDAVKHDQQTGVTTEMTGIVISSDFNTLFENGSSRFTPLDLQSFTNELSSTYFRIIGDINAKIQG